MRSCRIVRLRRVEKGGQAYDPALRSKSGCESREAVLEETVMHFDGCYAAGSQHPSQNR